MDSEWIFAVFSEGKHAPNLNPNWRIPDLNHALTSSWNCLQPHPVSYDPIAMGLSFRQGILSLNIQQFHRKKWYYMHKNSFHMFGH